MIIESIIRISLVELGIHLITIWYKIGLLSR